MARHRERSKRGSLQRNASVTKIAEPRIVIEPRNLVQGLAVAALLAGCAAQAPAIPRPPPDLVRRYAPPGPPGDPWGPFIRPAAAEFGVPEPLIYAVMRAESRGCQWLNGHPMQALTGEAGLMQIPLPVYAMIRRHIDVGPDPYLPRDNIRAGAYSLSLMIRQFGLPDALAAYQFGPTELAAARAAGGEPPPATQAYQREVWADYQDRVARRARGDDWRGPDQVVCLWPGH
jgi:soluble lytic murein transglycosylase-like protein